MSETSQGLLFLGPEWIQSVVRAAEAAKADDPYFQQLVANFTMNVKYVVTDLPEELREQYGGKDKLVFFVGLNHGSVRQIHFGRKPPNQTVHLVVTSDYPTAKKLFLRECGPATVFLNRRVTAEPMPGFRNWRAVLSPSSIVTAGRVLRMAQKVPTVFEAH